MTQQSLFNPLALVPEPVTDSEIAQLHRRYRRGQVSHEDFVRLNAIWVEANLDLYQPKPYAPIDSQLLDYAIARQCERGGFDAEKARGVASWRYRTFRLRMANDADRSLLDFFAAQLDEVAHHLATRIRGRVERYDSIDFPEQHFASALACQVNDAKHLLREQRDRGARG